ncbi:MAG: DUF2085 domain-containing protein [Clostridiales bacterium]|nr:DUF2085 domain-containing protein [Clostridiales bacterium]
MPKPGRRPLSSDREKTSSSKNRIIFGVYLSTAVAIVLWLGAIVWAPYLRSHYSPWQGFVYAVFSPLCHQVESRSFFLFGQPLAVCSRCLGIYIGFLAGVGLYPFLRTFGRIKLPRIDVFICLSFPIAIDTVGNFAGLWNTPNLARFATGLLWGPILPFYLITGIADLLLSRLPRKENNA